jgi:hypothetical protein
MTSPEKQDSTLSNKTLSRIASIGQQIVCRVDLLNRLTEAADKSGTISGQMVALPRKIQAASAALLLSSAATIIGLPTMKAFVVTPLVAPGAAFLTAILVPASEEERRRKKVAELQCYIHGNDNRLLLAEARDDLYATEIIRANNEKAEMELVRLITLDQQNTFSTNSQDSFLALKGSQSLNDLQSLGEQEDPKFLI